MAEEGSSSGAVLLLLVILLAGGGGAAWYFLIYTKKKKPELSVKDLLDNFSYQGSNYTPARDEGGLVWGPTGSEPWNFRYRFACTDKLGDEPPSASWSEPTGVVSHFMFQQPKLRVAKGYHHEPNECARHEKFLAVQRKREVGSSSPWQTITNGLCGFASGKYDGQQAIFQDNIPIGSLQGQCNS